MAAGGYVECNSSDGTYNLPDEQVFVLTDPEAPCTWGRVRWRSSQSCTPQMRI
jgi:hypothetical protein